MFGYIGAFLGGIVAAETVRLVFKACLDEALKKYDVERREMERKYRELQKDYAALEQSWNCKQAAERGKEIGRKMRDAERFAENVAKKNIEFKGAVK